MSTFEGPMMAIKTVNSLSHYTDWTIAHVHGGALGWVGMSAFAMLYWLVPRLWNRQLYSVKWANLHFWLSTVGIVLYIVALWVAGITQGLMWRAVGEDGGLTYLSFMDTVIELMPFYWIRLIGGLMYLGGVVLMAVNMVLTVRRGLPLVSAEEEERSDVQ